MTRFKRFILAMWFFVGSACLAQQVVITPDRPSGVYTIGEQIVWHIDVRGPNAAFIKQAKYVLKHCGLTVMRQGTLDLSTGSAVLETSLDEPGTILAEIRTETGGQTVRTLAGAAIEPEKISPSAPAPDDFDAFWAGQIARLAEIPANPQLEPAGVAATEVEYFKVKMDNIGGTHIYGQLAKPKKEGKYPALLILQWAGVYGLPSYRVVDRARQGWLALNIMPHDLPFDQPDDFYKRVGATTLKNYFTFGNEDRLSSYFLRMYLSAYRAADYLANRPDWDGKTLIVMGTSQGGQQTIMLSGLYPKITAMMAMVPSSCDVMGWNLGRAIGFPSWADQARERHDQRILQTARYFDPVNFSGHITCPALVAMGLLDETSPPAGVFAACNQMKGPKEVLILVNSDHQGAHNAQAPYNSRAEQWLKALVHGQSVPPEK
jgi:cephalosporin-C deacetylase